MQVVNAKRRLVHVLSGQEPDLQSNENKREIMYILSYTIYEAPNSL